MQPTQTQIRSRQRQTAVQACARPTNDLDVPQIPTVARSSYDSFLRRSINFMKLSRLEGLPCHLPRIGTAGTGGAIPHTQHKVNLFGLATYHQLNSCCSSLPPFDRLNTVWGEQDVDEHVYRAISSLAGTVQEKLPEPTLAQLWAAEQLRRAADRQIGDLLARARLSGGPGQPAYTWEDLGAVLGMSAQGARQRMLRQQRLRLT